jgi:hypothetical protein
MLVGNPDLDDREQVRVAVAVSSEVVTMWAAAVRILGGSSSPHQ